SNEVLQALSKPKWLVVMHALPRTSSEFWHAPGTDPAKIDTEVFLLPATHWIEKDGSFVNSGRWSQWKEQVLQPRGNSRHDHWMMADLFNRVKKLYQDGGCKFPDPILALTMESYKAPLPPTLADIAQQSNGKNMTTGTRLA